MECGEPMREVNIVAGKAAFADEDGDLGSRQRGAFGRRVDHHAGEPRRQRQAPQFLAFLGDAAVAVDGAEFGEQGFCLDERRARRRIEEGKILRPAAPGREVERQRRQIGGQDFRAGKRFERRGLRLVPQPVAGAGLGAAGAAAALVGGGARHPHGFEPRHPDIGLVARHAGKPGVDHNAHPLDGDRGLGDRGGQHDLAPAGRAAGSMARTCSSAASAP